MAAEARSGSPNRGYHSVTSRLLVRMVDAFS